MKYPAQLLIRVSRKTRQTLEKDAKIYQRSLSQWVRMLLEDAIRQRQAARTKGGE